MWPGVNVKAVPDRVQFGQLEPMSMFTGTVEPNLPLGPVQLDREYAAKLAGRRKNAS